MIGTRTNVYSGNYDDHSNNHGDHCYRWDLLERREQHYLAMEMKLIMKTSTVSETLTATRATCKPKKGQLKSCRHAFLGKLA